MPQGLIIRLGVLFISMCASLVYLMPSFVEKLPPWWTRLFPSEGLHLGLDLQGGTHLVLEVKVEKALQNNMEMKRTPSRMIKPCGILLCLDLLR